MLFFHHIFFQFLYTFNQTDCSNDALIQFDDCCDCDYLDIHDGSSINDPIVRTYNYCNSFGDAFSLGQSITGRLVTSPINNWYGYRLVFYRR